MQPYVSVIIPAYNSAAFLPAAITSVRAQDWEDLEIIVVDDGSTDHTMSVLDTLTGSDLRVFRQANSGPSAARNRGIKESQGEWVAFLDADCYWLPGKLDAQFSALSSNPEPAGFSYTGSLLVDEEGQTLATRPAVPRGCLVEDLVWGNLISTSSAIARREALLAVGMFDETLRIGEDWDLWLRLAANFEGSCVPEPLMAERTSCWDGKYQMQIYEAATLKIVPRFFDSLQGNQRLTLLARKKECALSWHLSVLAKSYLRRREVASFVRLAAKSVAAHPQGVGFLLSGRRPTHA